MRVAVVRNKPDVREKPFPSHEVLDLFCHVVRHYQRQFAVLVEVDVVFRGQVALFWFVMERHQAELAAMARLQKAMMGLSSSGG